MDKSTTQQVDDISATKKNALFYLSDSMKSKLMYLLTVPFIVVGIFMVLNNLYHAPPAQIIVDPKNLSATQYQLLNETMQAQQVGSFFSTNLPVLQDAALQMPWIEDVSIQRDWNRGIVISVLPRQPVAKFGSERLIDAQGQAYIPADARSLQQPNFVTLQGGTEQSALIMQMMQQVNMWYAPADIKVQDIFLSPRMTWLFRFDNGMRIIVDNENTYQKLFAVSQILVNQLASRRDEIQSIDLRYKNGFAITWKTDNIEPTSLLDTQD
ncbi:cell division protein FtsQ/DivIB [Psychrobacter sp. I-STPA10]|uniref:cell division protein FtsQ/DivIB n=1 Tax=Psychrobacter sp. I-STPA10 TaxID=2585769 RepID=UPI001E32D480|nr:cell division protein FtsQ/DivIB [Psychrobacter sp. I-STPA10]